MPPLRRGDGPEAGHSAVGAAPLEVEHRFGFSDPFSIGVEEELFVVDPLTGRQTNTAAAVLERLGEVKGRVEHELHACQVELITNIHAGAGDAVLALGDMRRAVLQTGTGLLASGTHPSARKVPPPSRASRAMSAATGSWLMRR